MSDLARQCEECGFHTASERYWIGEIEYYDLCENCVLKAEAYSREIEG